MSNYFENNTKDVIDEHLFIEALALTALEIPFREPYPQDAEKVILKYLLIVFK